jgi:hypothetical protein
MAIIYMKLNLNSAINLIVFKNGYTLNINNLFANRMQVYINVNLQKLMKK